MGVEPSEYILGTDRDELERLGFQHTTWVEEAYRLFAKARLGVGDRVLDLGCGPGYTTFELAQVVGPTGRVIARDQSARFMLFLRSECERRGLSQVEPSVGGVEELDLPRGSLDGAYARWLFCWLPDPLAVLRRVSDALRPGGAIALQEYLDWGSMKLMPRSEVFDRTVEACLASWRESGIQINFAERIPDLAAECGLEIEHYTPVARVGRAGSLEWRWMSSFFSSYLPRLVEPGLVTSEQVDADRAEWERRARDGRTYCTTPTMASIVLRKR